MIHSLAKSTSNSSSIASSIVANIRQMGAIHAKPANLTFEIEPTPLGPAPVTEIRPVADLDVEFVQIVGLSVGGLRAKGAFLEHDVGASDAKIGRVGRVGEVGEVLHRVGRDLVGREVDGVVVARDEHFVAFLDRDCGRGIEMELQTWV